MNEYPVRFGPTHGLSGVVSAPVGADAGVPRALLLSNVGMLSRIGPFRLYVELARMVGDAGWWALRFDESGMGDSAARASGPTRSMDANQDIIDAMDFLQETHGIEQFVLLGLCSGVDSIYAAAMQDTRVHGAIFIDGYSYPTVRYYVRRALRVFDGARWTHFVRRRMERMRTPQRPKSRDVFDRVYPPRAQFTRDIDAFTGRGARALFVFTATVDQVYNAPRQLFEILGASGDPSRITAVRAGAADHLFTRLSARNELIALVRRWMTVVGA